MTLEELKNFNPNTHEIYHDLTNRKYKFNRVWKDDSENPDIILKPFNGDVNVILSKHRVGSCYNMIVSWRDQVRLNFFIQSNCNLPYIIRKTLK